MKMHFIIKKRFNTFKIHTKEKYRKVSYTHTAYLQTSLQMTAIPLESPHWV